jgi:glutathione S-transferase
MPGPHAPKIKRLTGQTQTPVLVEGDTVVAGSASILDFLERRYPEPALYPRDDAERRRALEIQKDFDAEVGPAVRLAKFFEVLDAEYVVGTFCRHGGALARAAYRAAFPAIHQVMKRTMQINAANAERARERVSQALDFVSAEAGSRGYLIGSDFSLADLVCAALLMPAVSVTAWGGPTEHESDKNRRWLAAWADHPGAEWVREMFRRHRRPAPNGATSNAG